MYKFILSTLLMSVLHLSVYAQTTTFKAIVEDHDHEEAIIGATIFFEDLERGTVTDIEGFATIEDIPLGEHEIEVSFVGYEHIDTTITITSDMGLVHFHLEEHEEMLGGVTVQATRSTRTIKNIPTRVEFINSEELGEKAIMNAANISLVLRESTGIQIQQTSLSSGSSGIKIQGLDGRYTQLLKDGFPLFGGFSGGLSIMQIPPLDLNQFEIIKGSSSTLYGGGAIAGLVNMVSKTPEEDPSLDIMLSQTQALGSTANIFYGHRLGKFGYTLYGSGHLQKAYDPDGDDFSNLPETRSLSFNPKLFFYPNESTSLWFGLNGTYDDRQGGDISLIKDGENEEHQYYEDNKSTRLSSQLVFDKSVSENSAFQFRNSVSLFDNQMTTPRANFLGKQINSFTEANYSINKERSNLIFGANLYTNDFKEDAQADALKRDQNDVTFGAFFNSTVDLTDQFILEAGVRTDFAKDWGVFPLPRVSLLWKANDHFSTRLGGGMGYKIPDIFTEEASTLQYTNIQPIDKKVLEAERSYGLNLDLNYKGQISDQISVSINQLFYLTSINNSLLLNSQANGNLAFANAEGAIMSQGAETNIKFSLKDFRWFINYAFINASLNYLPGNPQKPLTAKHNAGTVLMYENDKWRIGYEAYYTGKQLLSDGTATKDFAIMGLMIQKHFKWGSPYINFENFTDQRQSKFSAEVLPTHENPVFPEIYAPTDGFIFSAGVVLKPFGQEHHAH